MKQAKPGPRVLGHIAEILGAEGFTDFAANEVKRYWKRRVVSDRQQGRIKQITKAFGQMVTEKLDERDKIVLGKYIAMLSAAQFDTGLRLGLMTLATELDAKVQA